MRRPIPMILLALALAGLAFTPAVSAGEPVRVTFVTATGGG